MKITVTQHRELNDGRIVKPGDTLESPKDGTNEQLQAYVDNGIGFDSAQPPVAARPPAAGQPATQTPNESAAPPTRDLSGAEGQSTIEEATSNVR